MSHGSTRATGFPHIMGNRGCKASLAGASDFAAVVGKGVYVDKSLFIRDLLNYAHGSAMLFCRPRGFGKSLGLDMLQCFFEAPVAGFVPDRRGLFENLAIWGEGERCREEQGAYPVIRISFGDAKGTSWDEMRRCIASAISSEYRRHFYLSDSACMGMNVVRAKFERTAAGEEEDGLDLEGSLAWLSRLLSSHHGPWTVILIDDFDKPLVESWLGGYASEAGRFMGSLLTDALKSSDNLRLACMTGEFHTPSGILYDSLNNLVIDTSLGIRNAEAFGFTGDEVEALASYAGMGDRIREIRNRCGGYRFGKTEVYNPASVLRFLEKPDGECDTSGDRKLGTSGDGSLEARLFQQAGKWFGTQLQALVRGDSVEAQLDVRSALEDVSWSPKALWAGLYLLGCITTDDVERPNDPSVIRRLRLPNREVRSLFNREFGTDRAALHYSTIG